VAAARLFCKSSGELIGIHIALALGSQGTQDFRGRRRQAAAPQGQAFGWRRRHRRHLAGCLETAGSRDDQAIAFGDVAEQPQVLSAGIEVAAARLKAGQGGELAPGEARWCMAGGSGQELARGGMQDIRRDSCSIGDKGHRRWLDWFFRGQGLFRLGWLRADSDGRRGCSQCANVGEAGLQFTVFLFEIGDTRIGGRELLFKLQQMAAIFRLRARLTPGFFSIGGFGGRKRRRDRR
jgi:hypothetical protein